jgi:hypothetical protein
MREPEHGPNQSGRGRAEERDRLGQYGADIHCVAYRAEFGLSRFSASRGLDELERAELVSVRLMPGRSPVVTIRDVGGTNR